MRKIAIGVMLGALGLFAWQRVTQPAPAANAADFTVEAADAPREAAPGTRPVKRPKYTCDGREHCSQMTSCEEAIYFLENCPNVKMDGEGDGIPCEKQWCEDRLFR